ncbi:MAG: ATP/GTP-binding protein [Candidatus Geothermarchaeales archaeon]
MTGVSFIIGSAGSGKSELTASLSEWLRREDQDVAIFNLDPGVLKTPYVPDIDIREYVNVQDLMSEYGLGPNGGLVLAMDLAADYIESVNKEIAEMNPDHLIVDTSGQMELFAYRASGTFFTNALHGETKAIVFLFDGMFCSDPRNFLSSVLLSSSIHYRFMLPVINILNKTDLLSEDVLKKEIRWSSRPQSLIKSLEEHIKGEEILYLTKLTRLLHTYLGKTWFIPVSARTLNNFSTFIAVITRILFKGEEKLS